MDEKTHWVYEFGPFRLDPGQRVLSRAGEMVNLAPKVFETLSLLVQNHGIIMEKEKLIQALWPESFVEDGNLTQNIFLLRKLLGDDRNGNSFIQNIPRRGYRFVAAVTEMEAELASTGPPESDYWSHHSPFRSLQIFEPEDAWLFFGRDAEIEDLMERLGRAPVLVMVGNSGSGKSSLIRAGLIPALRAGRFCDQGSPIHSWRVVIFRPSAAPFDYLAEVLPNQLAPELTPKEQSEFIAENRLKFPQGGDALRNAITALAQTQATTDKPGAVHVLLVADQFEEIFTLTNNQHTRDRYLELLLAAARLGSAVSIHLLLALRADFYAYCLDHAGLSRCLETGLYNVPRMTGEQLRESIEKRLQLASARAEPGLIDALLEDVGGEPGNLALLEHTLGQLWEQRSTSNRTLSNRTYAEIGRLRGALGKHADEVYGSLGNEQQKRLAQRIFLELVHLGEGSQDTRRRVPKSVLSSLGAPNSVEPLLARLASSRLVSTGREGDETYVEVSHEALIREWPALREWIQQNREELGLERRLLQAAEEWQMLKHDPGALLQGARLAQGEEWLTRHADAVPLLRQFLQASVQSHVATQERELAQQKELRSQAEARAEAEKKLREEQAAGARQAQRSAWRLRWLSYALAILLLVALVAAWVAYRQQRIERSHALAAQAAELTARDHGSALALALQSWRTAKTEETRLAVTKAFPELLATLNHEGAVKRVLFSPNGQQILSASADRTARLWDASDGRLLATLRGHTDEVEYAAFSPDGRQIVTASHDHTARLWSAEGQLLTVLAGHTEIIEQPAYSPDGKLIVTPSWDRTVRLWSSVDGRLLAVLQGHTDAVLAASFSPDGLHIVTASKDHTSRVWSSTDGHLEATLIGHTEWVYDAQFFPDGERIITTSWDRTARIWSRDGRPLVILQHDGPVDHTQFSPDGQRVVTVSEDHTARIWSSSDGRLLFTLHHDGPIHHAEFSRDGRRILTASNDHTARIWSSADGRLLAMLEGHTDVVHDAAFSSDGRRVATASGDHTVRTWNTASGLLVADLQGHTSYLKHAEFSPDGTHIVTLSQDQTARIWNSKDGRLVATLQGGNEGFQQARFSPDSQQVLTAGHDNNARVWKAADGRLLVTLSGHTNKVEQALFSPDGQRIVTASSDCTAKVWNAATGHLLATLQGHAKTIWHAVFSPDGQRIVTASDDHTARVWDSVDGRLLAVLQGHTGPVWRAAFSPDGRQIVTASFDHTARLWNSADGRLISTLSGHSDLVDAAKFSPDGQQVLTASWDSTARLWNSADGHLLAILRGHTARLIDAAYSPDGSRIATASDDHTARLWSRADYGLLAILRGHGEEVWQASFSPDGQFIVTASLDQTGRIWRVLTLDDLDALLTR